VEINNAYGEKLDGNLLVRNFPKSERIFLANSKGIKQLTIRNCPQIKEIDVYDNQISKLDISKLVNLEILHCGKNKLTKLNISQNKKLKKLICFNNPLGSIEGADEVEGLRQINSSLGIIDNLNKFHQEAMKKLEKEKDNIQHELREMLEKEEFVQGQQRQEELSAQAQEITQARVKELETELIRLKLANNKLVLEGQESTEKLDEEFQFRQKVTKEKDELQEKISQLQIDKDTLNNHLILIIANQQNELNEEKQAYDNLVERYNNLQTKSTNILRSLTEINEQNQQLLDRPSVKVFAGVLQSLYDLQGENKNFHQEIGGLQNQLTITNERVNGLTDERDIAYQENYEVRQKTIQEVRKVKFLQKKAANLRQGLKEEKMKLTQSNQELTDARQLIGDLEQNLNDNQGNLRDSEQAYSLLKEIVSDKLLMEFGIEEATARSGSELIIQLNEVIDRHRNANSNLLEFGRVNKSLSDELEIITNENLNLEQSLNVERKANRKLNSELRQKKELFQEKLARNEELEIMYNQAVQNQNEKEQQLQNLKEVIELERVEKEKIYAEYQNFVQQTQQENKRFQSEIEGVAQLTSMSEKFKKSLEQERNQNQKLSQKLRATEEFLANELNKLKVVKGQLQEQIEINQQLEAKQVQNSQTIQDLETNLIDSKNALNETKIQLEETDLNYENLEQNYEKDKKKLLNQFLEIQTDLQQEQIINRNKQQTIDQLTETVEEKKQRILALEADKAELMRQSQDQQEQVNQGEILEA
jgi:hypothetical protein